MNARAPFTRFLAQTKGGDECDYAACLNCSRVNILYSCDAKIGGSHIKGRGVAVGKEVSVAIGNVVFQGKGGSCCRIDTKVEWGTRFTSGIGSGVVQDVEKRVCGDRGREIKTLICWGFKKIVLYDCYKQGIRDSGKAKGVWRGSLDVVDVISFEREGESRIISRSNGRSVLAEAQIVEFNDSGAVGIALK